MPKMTTKPYIVSWSGSCAIEANSEEEAVALVKKHPDVIVGCAYKYEAKEQPYRMALANVTS